jgi:hypothetical protein
LADIKKKYALKDLYQKPAGGGNAVGSVSLQNDKNKQTVQKTTYQQPAQQMQTQQPAMGTYQQPAPYVAPQSVGNAMSNLQSTYEQMQKTESAKPGEYSPSADLTALQGNLAALEGKRPAGYTPDQAVVDAQNALQNLQKPGEYQSRYDAQINGILNTIAGAKEFNYQAAEDPMYRMYRDTYLRMGQRAAEDAMANASALTGGYGSSYGQMAANQANQNYIAELNNQMPTLMQMAYQRHQDQIADNYNQLNAFQSAENMDYGKYRDTVGDYQTERQYLANRYDTEYSKDYQEYRDLVGDYNDELMYMYGKYNDMSDAEYQKYMNNMDLWLQDRNYWLQKHGLMQDQANYMQEWEYKTRDAQGGGGGGGYAPVQQYNEPVQQTNVYGAQELMNKYTGVNGNVIPQTHALKDQKQAMNYAPAHAVYDDGTPYTLKQMAKMLSDEEEEKKVFGKYKQGK